MYFRHKKMGLSGLDSKKCQTILQYKAQIATPSCNDLIISDKTMDCNKKIDEYGETMVSHLNTPRREFSPEDIDIMITTYQAGKATTYQLSEQFGCSKTTISKILKEHGVNVTKCKASLKLDDDVVITMYEEMHTTDEIAKHFKVHPQVILKCLRNHGVKIRSRWDYSKK